MYIFPIGTPPAKICGIPFTGVDNYEEKQPGAGIGLKYARPSASLTVYLFTAQAIEIPSKVTAPAVLQVFNMAITDILAAAKNRIYEAVDMEGPASYDGRSDADQAYFLVQRFVVTGRIDRQQKSILLVGVVDGYFLKVRYSSDYIPDDAYNRLLDEIIRRFNPIPTNSLCLLNAGLKSH